MSSIPALPEGSILACFGKQDRGDLPKASFTVVLPPDPYQTIVHGKDPAASLSILTF
jgi:hypothetical protein